MKNDNREKEVTHKDNASVASSTVAGLVIGGLAGAGAALLFAPQSGKETRQQIQQKTVELRDRTAETVGEAVSQVKSKTHQMTVNLHDKAEELQQQGKEMIAEKLERVSTAADAGKAALTNEPEKTADNTYR